MAGHAVASKTSPFAFDASTLKRLIRSKHKHKGKKRVSTYKQRVVCLFVCFGGTGNGAVGGTGGGGVVPRSPERSSETKERECTRAKGKGRERTPACPAVIEAAVLGQRYAST